MQTIRVPHHAPQEVSPRLSSLALLARAAASRHSSAGGCVTDLFVRKFLALLCYTTPLSSTEPAAHKSLSKDPSAALQAF